MSERIITHWYIYAFWDPRSYGIKPPLDVSSGRVLLFKTISFSAYAVLKSPLRYHKIHDKTEVHRDHIWDDIYSGPILRCVIRARFLRDIITDKSVLTKNTVVTIETSWIWRLIYNDGEIHLNNLTDNEYLACKIMAVRSSVKWWYNENEILSSITHERECRMNPRGRTAKIESCRDGCTWKRCARRAFLSRVNYFVRSWRTCARAAAKNTVFGLHNN